MRWLYSRAKYSCLRLPTGFSISRVTQKKWLPCSQGWLIRIIAVSFASATQNTTILTKFCDSNLVWKVELFPCFQDCHFYIRESCCAKKDMGMDICMTNTVAKEIRYLNWHGTNNNSPLYFYLSSLEYKQCLGKRWRFGRKWLRLNFCHSDEKGLNTEIKLTS